MQDVGGFMGAVGGFAGGERALREFVETGAWAGVSVGLALGSKRPGGAGNVLLCCSAGTAVAALAVLAWASACGAARASAQGMSLACSTTGWR